MIVDIVKFGLLVEREKQRISELPEHTLDWYTHVNRVTLLEEVEALFTEAKTVTEPKKVTETKKASKEEEK